MDNTEDNILELLKVTTKLATQVEGLNDRIGKLECIITNDVKQDQRITSVEETAMGCSSRFNRIEERLGTIEKAEGNRSYRILSSIGKQLLAAFVSFVIVCIGFYIMNK